MWDQVTKMRPNTNFILKIIFIDQWPEKIFKAKVPKSIHRYFTIILTKLNIILAAGVVSICKNCKL